MLNRLYSILEIKGFDTEQRTLRGVATTPTTDRTGDVIDMAGVTFTNPLPLLLYHDARQPVGTVRLDPPTAAGVTFTAALADCTEPPALKARIDEAWSSLKSNLIRGVSIGFRALEDAIEPIAGKARGVRFKRIEILELSLVAIPANAEATIAMLKHYDSTTDARSTAIGHDGSAAVVRYRPGVTGTTSRTHTMYADQIKGLQMTRAAKVDERAGLQQAADKEGRTKNESEQETFDTLTREIASLDREVKDHELLEAEQIKTAAPVRGDSPDAGTRSRGGEPVIQIRRNLEPGQEFAQAVLCKIAAFSAMQRGEPRPAAEFAKTWYPDNPRIALYLKAPVNPGTTTDATWAGPLIDPANLAGEFSEFLRPMTIIGNPAFASRVTSVPFNVRIIGQTSGGAGYWVGQAKPKPLTKFDFAATTLGFSKVASISVISEELARFSTPSAEMLVRKALAEAIVARIDQDLIDPLKAAVAGVSPASLTNGVTPTATTGVVIDDLQALMAAYLTNNQNVANLVLIMPNTLALSLSMMRTAQGAIAFPTMGVTGGVLEGIPVVTSQHAKHATAGNLVVAVNGSDVFVADDGQVSVEASNQASLEMLDGTFVQAPPTGAALVSMWQNNLIALKAERFIHWAKRQANAVVYMENVTWSGGPSTFMASAARADEKPRRA